MTVYQRNLQIATIIAESILDWEWRAGAWYKGEERQTDFFDPMNIDEQAEALLNSGLDITITEKELATGMTYMAETPNHDKEVTGCTSNTLWVSASLKRVAVCFILCMMLGNDPMTWQVEGNEKVA